MRIRTFALASAALAVSAAIAWSATKPISKPADEKKGGPVMSVLNRPWPAKVQKKQPKFPPALSPAQEAATFHMAPGYQVELVAADPLLADHRLLVEELRLFVDEEEAEFLFKS